MFAKQMNGPRAKALIDNVRVRETVWPKTQKPSKNPRVTVGPGDSDVVIKGSEFTFPRTREDNGQAQLCRTLPQV